MSPPAGTQKKRARETKRNGQRRIVVEFRHMRGYERTTYGDKIAGIYDSRIAEYGIDDPATVPTLEEYAGGGRSLELGIGTGRVAIPLAQRGVEVHGIEISEAMMDRMRAKRGGEKIDVTIGDFADVKVEGTFSLVYCVFHTFFGLTTRDEQVACFRNVAEHLEPGGFFLIECFVPDVTLFDRGQRVHAKTVTADRIELGVSVHDSVNQRVYGHTVELTDGNVSLYPIEIRYAWPSELDMMGELAGLHLRERWGGWRREPFTVASTQHVSLYEKPRS